MTKEIVQMEPRNNRGNRFEKGITPAERYGTNPLHNTGVPLQGHKGEPKDQGRGQFGVPIPGQGNVAKRAPAPPTCVYTTKAGEPCKAAPMKNTSVCVGHARAEASG